MRADAGAGAGVRTAGGGWLALAATERGAAHIATKRPSQDAVATCALGPDGVAVAVADGHGHQRHFRSGRGAELAVAVGCDAARELASRLAQAPPPALGHDAVAALVPAVTGGWRAAVAADLEQSPFTSAEQRRRQRGDAPLIAYGATFLLAVAWRRWLVLAQIGDGDILAVQPDGGALLPVPGDAALDGRHTTSLCGPQAEQEFRLAVLDTARTPLLGLLLATDGYANAQAADPWAGAVSADLAAMIAGRSPGWLAAQLPSWAARCASGDGSADDTTMALLLVPAATGLAAGSGPGGHLVPAAGRGPDDAVTDPPPDTRWPDAGPPGSIPPASIPSGSPPSSPSGTRSGSPGGTPSGSNLTSPGPADPLTPGAEATVPGSGAGPAGAGVASPGASAARRLPRRHWAWLAAAAVVAGVLAALIASLLPRSAADVTTSRARPAHSRGVHPSASATASADRRPGSGPSADGRCRPPARLAATLVRGRFAVGCDPRTGKQLRVPLAGLPAGLRLALEANGSMFVLVANTLRTRPVAGPAGWRDLGAAPIGLDQGMCLSRGLIITVAAHRTTAARGILVWTAATMTPSAPGALSPGQRTAGDPCPAVKT